VKKGYKLPRACMTNADVTRLINSDEVQSVVNAPKVRPAGRCVIDGCGRSPVFVLCSVILWQQLHTFKGYVHMLLLACTHCCCCCIFTVILQESGAKHYALKKNPLKNLGAMIKLNPQAASARR
jgi:hypothetical protein